MFFPRPAEAGERAGERLERSELESDSRQETVIVINHTEKSLEFTASLRNRKFLNCLNTTNKTTNAIRSHCVSQKVQLRDAKSTFGLVNYKAIRRKQFEMRHRCSRCWSLGVLAIKISSR